MKILFYKGEGEIYAEPNDVARDDGETIEFSDTEIANVDQDNQDYATIYTTGDHFYITLTAEDVNKISHPKTIRDTIIGARAIDVMFVRPKPNASIKTRIKVCAAHDAAMIDDWDEEGIAEWLAHFHGYPTDEATLEQVEREQFIEDLAQIASEEEMASPAFKRYEIFLPEGVYAFTTEDEAYEFWCVNYDSVMRMYEVTNQ